MASAPDFVAGCRHSDLDSEGGVVPTQHTTAQLASDGFTAYGTSHLVVMGMLVTGSVAVIRLGWHRRQPGRVSRECRAFGLALLTVVIPLQVAVLTASGDDVRRQLPLQLCDLAALVASYALLTRKRWAVALTYFWGLTLVPQAVLTPDLRTGFPHPIFLLFWGMHLLVIWAALYLTWGLRLTPDWRSYRIAVGRQSPGWASHSWSTPLSAPTTDTSAPSRQRDRHSTISARGRGT
jgi:hypothetical integral membrane protein (TIGR02206 family)